MCSPCLTTILTEGGGRGKKERLAHTLIPTVAEKDRISN